MALLLRRLGRDQIGRRRFVHAHHVNVKLMELLLQRQPLRMPSGLNVLKSSRVSAPGCFLSVKVLRCTPMFLRLWTTVSIARSFLRAIQLRGPSSERPTLNFSRQTPIARDAQPALGRTPPESDRRPRCRHARTHVAIPVGGTPEVSRGPHLHLQCVVFDVLQLRHARVLITARPRCSALALAA